MSIFTDAFNVLTPASAQANATYERAMASYQLAKKRGDRSAMRHFLSLAKKANAIQRSEASKATQSIKNSDVLVADIKNTLNTGSKIMAGLILSSVAIYAVVRIKSE